MPGGQAFRQARDQQGCSGAVLRGHNRHLAGRHAIGLRHIGARVFLAVADLADAAVNAGKRDLAGVALPEQIFHFMPLEAVGNKLRIGHFHSMFFHRSITFFCSQCEKPGCLVKKQIPCQGNFHGKKSDNLEIV